MRPRRVAYVVNVFPKVSETFIAGELTELIRKGIDLRILSLRRPDPVCSRLATESPPASWVVYDADRFDAVLQDFRPELVHAHFATQAAAVAREWARRRSVPFTFTAHGYDVYRRPPADFADRAAAAAAVVTVSDANARHIATTFGVPRSHIHVIGCGVDTDRFQPARRPIDSATIVCVARLRPVKNLPLLLHACAVLRERGVEFRCVIAGEGDERTALEALRRTLNLDGVVALPGAATQAEVCGYWRTASVAVLTSHSEGMPVSLMEAAACGVPAVATAVGGVPELVAHGASGFLVAPGDRVALADALERLLRNRLLRDEMGRAARHRAEQKFSRPRQVGRLLDLWGTLLSEHRPRSGQGRTDGATCM